MTYEPIAAGTRWGRPWSTLWLHVQGTVPAELERGPRHPGRDRRRPRLHRWTRLQRRGPGLAAGRHDHQGHLPRQHLAAGGLGVDRLLPGGRRQPRRGRGHVRRQLPPDPAGRQGDRGRRPALRAAGLRRRAARPRGLGADPRHLDAARPDGRAERRRRAPVRDPARPQPDGRRGRSGRRRRHRLRGPSRSSPPCWPPRPPPRPTRWWPSATPTSTPPGCGRCGRPSARWPGPGATSPISPTATPTSCSPAPRPSSTPG